MSDKLELQTDRLEVLFADDLDQSARVAAGNIHAGRNLQHPRNSFSLATSNGYLIIGFDDVRGFRRPSVKENKARVAKLLS